MSLITSAMTAADRARQEWMGPVRDPGAGQVRDQLSAPLDRDVLEDDQVSDLSGRRTSLAEALSAEKLPVVLVFLQPGCGPCAVMAAELPGWRQRLAGAVTLMLIGTKDAGRNISWAHDHQASDLLIPGTNDLYKHYRLQGSPAAVLVDAAGRIASPAAGGVSAIRDLLTSTRPAR